MKNLSVQGASSSPTAFITIGRQRVKQYDKGVVYLKTGQEFEIELFNPTQSKVLAQIELNGQSIGSGVVIKPGQRAYLERYIDEAKKFLFDVYEIDSNDAQAVQAASKNGIVKIQFYEELIYSGYPYTTNTIWYSGTPNNFVQYGTSGNINLVNSNPIVTNGSSYDGTVNCSYSTSASASIPVGAVTSYTANVNPNPIETGRVEKGGSSNQAFTTDFSNYGSYPSTVVEWVIMPESRKQVSADDLIVHCTECGAKRKKQSHKYCPHCGTKF